jgi:hypothetical protein
MMLLLHFCLCFEILFALHRLFLLPLKLSFCGSDVGSSRFKVEGFIVADDLVQGIHLRQDHFDVLTKEGLVALCKHFYFL